MREGFPKPPRPQAASESYFEICQAIGQPWWSGLQLDICIVCEAEPVQLPRARRRKGGPAPSMPSRVPRASSAQTN